MKIQSNFDTTQRSICLEPEDELEALLLSDMVDRAEKGQIVTLKSIKHTEDKGLFVLIKVNGK